MKIRKQTFILILFKHNYGNYLILTLKKVFDSHANTLQ